MATTVIVGSGIIGLSTAYYLSQRQPGSSIHLVDSSTELFASASGYAGGFLARDWYPKLIRELADLSYNEHEKLAQEFNGTENWAYAKSVTVNHDFKAKKHEGDGKDWLLEGTSRAGLVEERRDPGNGDVPPWLRRVEGDGVDVVDGGEGTAVVEPLRLCKFLLEKCKAEGVQIHYPATALRAVTDLRGELASVRIGYTDCSTETELPASRLLISCGAWTPQVFKSLFNTSSIDIPIASLGGHSLVVKNPKDTGGPSYSLYSTLDTLAPEIYSRPNGVIYLAGVNSPDIPLPPLATGARPVQASVEKLKQIAKQFIDTDEELEVVRTGLCFRPVTERGYPYVLRMKDEDLGPGWATRTGGDGGVFIAAGHGPWGISLSLGTGKVMAELMQGRQLSADISALGL